MTLELNKIQQIIEIKEWKVQIFLEKNLTWPELSSYLSSTYDLKIASKIKPVKQIIVYFLLSEEFVMNLQIPLLYPYPSLPRANNLYRDQTTPRCAAK